MRKFYTLLTLVITLSLVSCKKDDDGNDSFLLSAANLAGTYDVELLTTNIESTVIVQGIPVNATINVVGSTFQIDFVFNENGTFDASGEFLSTTTTTVAGQTETDQEIIVVNSAGDYTVDANNMTITIIPSDGDLFGDIFDVDLFNESTVRMSQLIEEPADAAGNSSTTITRFNLRRK